MLRIYQSLKTSDMNGPTIYFVRHGQTDWNAEQRFQGQRDIPINANGRQQAAKNGQTLKELLNNPADFDYVSSPLGRACETMEIIRRALDLPCLLYTSPSPRDKRQSRMPSSA